MNTEVPVTMLHRLRRIGVAYVVGVLCNGVQTDGTGHSLTLYARSRTGTGGRLLAVGTEVKRPPTRANRSG